MVEDKRFKCLCVVVVAIADAATSLCSWRGQGVAVEKTSAVIDVAIAYIAAVAAAIVDIAIATTIVWTESELCFHLHSRDTAEAKQLSLAKRC